MTLKEQTISHYNRMIAWALKQNPKESASSHIMKSVIGEDWSSTYCPLCKSVQGRGCGNCPIASEGYYNCRNTPWENLSYARTWEQWINIASDEILFLEELDFEGD